MSSAIAAARGRRPRQHLFASNAEMDDWMVAQYRAGSSSASRTTWSAAGCALAGSPYRDGQGTAPTRAECDPPQGGGGLRHRCPRPRDRRPLCPRSQRVNVRQGLRLGQQAVRTALYWSDLTPARQGRPAVEDRSRRRASKARASRVATARTIRLIPGGKSDGCETSPNGVLINSLRFQRPQRPPAGAAPWASRSSPPTGPRRPVLPLAAFLGIVHSVPRSVASVRAGVTGQDDVTPPGQRPVSRRE